MSELQEHKDSVEEFISATLSNREDQKRDRDYYDGKQWTAAQMAKLRARNQAPIVVNRIKPKVEGLLGLYIMRSTDPKAYPRTREHEEASNAITDSLRYVADNTDFDQTKSEVAENFFIEGVAGAIVQSSQNARGETEVEVSHIPFDMIYYDPYSRKKDFTDALFKGQMIWIDEKLIPQKFGDVRIEDIEDADTEEDTTFEDRPRWHDKQRKRVRVAMHFYLKDEIWYMHIFSGNVSIVPPAPSPFLDEFGIPDCPIELVSAYVDRHNNRYSEVRGLIDQQDEINHRRSKGLHLLSQRQTKSSKNAIKDVGKLKRELAKPDGHVEVEGEAADFDIIGTSDMAQGQFSLYQDAKAEMDSTSFNAQLAGERQQGDLSGKAIDKLQSAGVIELNRQYNLLNNWEKRIYRQIWARVKQEWTEEKWVRITDDQDNLRWVGLNSQITYKDFLQEIMEDESKQLEMRIGASLQYRHMVETQHPALNQVVMVKNDVAEIDADVKIEQSFDVVNIQQEQFEMLLKFGQGSDIDITELIELSQIRGKDELIDKIKERREQAAQANGNIQAVQAQGEQAKMRKINAEAVEKEQAAIQRKIENTLLINSPERVDSISV